MTAKFLGSTEKLSPSQTYSCRKFIRKNKQSRLKQIHQYYIDTVSLLGLFNLDCSHCHDAHFVSCCDRGRPYAPEETTLINLQPHAKQIVSNHLSQQHYDAFISKGYIEMSEETDFYQNFTMCNENCFFLTEGKQKYCSIHRHAIENEVSVFSIKPLSCLMYPLDMIEIDGHILITALHEDTESFCRWGDDYFTQFLCANPNLRTNINDAGDRTRSNMKKNIPSEIFALHRYEPAYRWGKETIIHLFGRELYSEMELMLQK